MDDIIKKMAEHTDMNHWYWLSYGEKCYAFAVASAHPVDDNVVHSKGGGELVPDNEKKHVWLTEDGTEMYIDEFIVERESQDGNTVCSFIARAYTELMKNHLPK